MQDIDHWHSQQHYHPANIVLDNPLSDIATQLFSTPQLLVVTLRYSGGEEHLFLQTNDHGQLRYSGGEEHLFLQTNDHGQLRYSGGEEHLFLQTNDHGQVFAFSNQEGFLEEVQLIHNVMSLLTSTYEYYDQESDSLQMRAYLFFPGKSKDR